MNLLYCEPPKGLRTQNIAGEKQLDSFSDAILRSGLRSLRCVKPCVKAYGQVARGTYV
jgi:hypothetical protein